MVKYKLILLVFITLMLLLVEPTPIVGQDNEHRLPKNLEPITSENAQKVRELLALDSFTKDEHGNIVRDWVRTLGFSPDAATLATGNWFDSGRIWSLDPITEIGSMPYKISVCDLQFSPNGSLISLNDLGYGTYLWDTHTNEPITSFTGQGEIGNNQCGSSSFSPNSLFLAYIADDGRVHLWNVEDRTESSTLQTGKANLIAFSPDSKLLAASTLDGNVELWNTTTATRISTFIGHKDRISSLAFSPDGSLLATGGYDFTVYIWDVVSGLSIHSLESDDHYIGGIAHLTFSPDGSFIAFHGADSVSVWEVNLWKRAGELDEHAHPTSLLFSSDGSLIILGTLGGTLNLWDFVADKNRILETENTSSPWINDIAISHDGLLIGSAGENGTTRLWGVPSD